MAVEICVPRLGTVKSDAKLSVWIAGEGARVEAGDLLLTIETQKINFEVTAEQSGFLHIVVPVGETCAVGTVVGMIAASELELAELQKQGLPPVYRTVSPTVAADQTEQRTVKRSRSELRISPVARKMAEENGIDPATLVGTGPGGRIVREDIEKAIATKAEPAQSTAEKQAEAILPVSGEKRVKHTVPLRGMRGAIAERMQQSLARSAQLSALGEIDMSELIQLRKAFLAREQRIGTRVTFNDILVFVFAKVLKENPIVNASILGPEITIWDEINIGIAVALPDGLIVPVIKNADRKSISEISKISKVLIQKARAGKLAPEDIVNGTFTITNLGSAGAGWRFETSIINPPESAIFGAGGITERAVVRDGQIVIRPIMTYGFTYDHRVIDGATAVRFMARAIELLENPALFNL